MRRVNQIKLKKSSPGQPWTLGYALLLAFDATKPLRRRDGLVVLANANNLCFVRCYLF
jgi:hypothetical protein